MSRNIISILMSSLFLVLIATPTIVTFIDDSIDVSFFYDSGEEEEGNEKSEKNKEKEVLLFEFSFLESDFTDYETENNLEFFFKKYSKPHLNLISPPPQLHIL
ncbi:MAG: hypothetical protein ABJK28_05305 [Algibacter sp.]